MRATILSLFALLVSYGILCLGHGLNNTLLGVRATMEGFPDWVTGLMMSAYFGGFLTGAFLSAHLIPSVGQIRVFAAFASLASAVSLIHVLVVDEVTWIVLRFVYGMCMSTLYIVIEGWLNVLSTREIRGKLLSVYMAINFLALALGQAFFFLADPESFELFAAVSILISVALIPLTLSQSKQPETGRVERLGFRRLFRISPLATVGCLSNGLTMGAFWGLSAVYMTRIGLAPDDCALALGVSFVGGLVFQWPIGLFSDMLDRRVTIGAVLIGSGLICAGFVFMIRGESNQLTPTLLLLSFFFGGFSYTLYSLFIALANDFLDSKQALAASARLISYHAIGAISGPTLASLLMAMVGSSGLFIFIGGINIAISVVAAYQLHRGRTIPVETHEAFVSIPKTTGAVLALDPRGHAADP